MHTIYLKKTDFNFIKTVINIQDHIEFKSIKELNNSQYEIKITEAELISFAEICAHACDFIKSDKKAQRLDSIALMLEGYIDGL